MSRRLTARGERARVASTDARRGFSLVELVIATALGTLLLLAIYQALLVNQRAFQTQSARISVQQTVRGAVDVLSSLLREVSASAGDLVSIGPDSVHVRTPIAFGVSCDVTTAPTVVVEPLGVWLNPGDSILVLAENDPADPSDDLWLKGLAGDVDTMRVCPSGARAAQVDLLGLTPPLGGQVLGPGAPIRAFVTMSWGLREVQGVPYLAQWRLSTPVVPLVGPLGPTGLGLEFHFLDGAGSPVADPLQVAQIEFSVRAYSRILDRDGTPIADSLTTRVSLRN